MAVGPGCFSADWAPLAAAEARPARAWQYAGSWLLGKMESKTLLLDLVQQRKDGRITQPLVHVYSTCISSHRTVI